MEQRALNLIRGLSIKDFGEPGVQFLPDGRIVAAERPPLDKHELELVIGTD